MEPRRHLRTIWTSAMTSCVRAPTSRSVRQEKTKKCLFWSLFLCLTETIETYTQSLQSTFENSLRSHPETLIILKSDHAQTPSSLLSTSVNNIGPVTQRIPLLMKLCPGLATHTLKSLRSNLFFTLSSLHLIP